MCKILVNYCYYERDETYIQNLAYFIHHGILAYHKKHTIFYNIIINGKCSISIDELLGEHANVRIIRRENADYDFGAYNHALDVTSLRDYDFFVFLNTSVRGPFLPPYYKGHWLDPFIDLFIGDVHLVGTTINILELKPTSREAIEFYHLVNGFTGPYTHVQTQFFMLDTASLNFLRKEKFFESRDIAQKDFIKFIAEKELMLSHLILTKAKWNISCIIPEYQNIDYRKIYHDFNIYSKNGDPCFTGACFGRTMHPYETIFIKTNRGIAKNEIDSLSKKRLFESKV